MMMLITRAQSAAVTSKMKIGTPKMKILMIKVEISFITEASTGLKKTRSPVMRASQLFLTAF